MCQKLRYQQHLGNVLLVSLKQSATYESKTVISTDVVLPGSFQDQKISIKSNPFTNKPYIIN